MTNVIVMIGSTSTLILAVILSILVKERMARRPRLRAFVLGLAFGGAGLLSMMVPIEPAPGVRVDARHVVVALAMLSGGVIPATTSTVILILARIVLGGVGALPGIVALIVGLVVMALIDHRNHRDPWRPQKSSWMTVIWLALASGLVPMVITLIYYSSASHLMWVIIFAVVPTNLIGTLILSVLIQMEEERRMKDRSLKEAQAQLRAVTSNAPCALFQLVSNEDQSDFDLRFISEGASRILGITPEALIANPMQIGERMDAESWSALGEALVRSFREMEPLNMDIETTTPSCGKLWVNVSAVPRRSHTGEVVLDGTFFDITEKKLAEKRKVEFISTVSHELRTPLTSIRGSLSLVSEGLVGEVPEKIGGLVRIALKNSERLVVLINDILDVEKIEAGKIALDYTEVNVRSVVDEVVESLSGFKTEKNLELVVEDRAPGATIRVDRGRFIQIINNYLSNAMKFSPDGGMVRIRIAPGRRDYVRVSVMDTGPGIPLEFQPRVFGRFEQADSSDVKRESGTGLGLSIVRALAERMKGGVGFRSTPGRGATFWIEFLDHTAGEGLSEPEAPALDLKRFLICEDDDGIATILATRLTDAGIASDRAATLAEADRLLGRRKYDGMVLDLVLPDGDGGAWLRRHERLRASGIPVMVLSAHAEDRRAALTIEAGGASWLQKPADLEKVMAALRAQAGLTETLTSGVLHIEDDPHVRKMIGGALEGVARVDFAPNLGRARQMLERREYGLVLLDLDLPDGHGETLFQEIPPQTKVVVFSAREASAVDPTLAHAAFVKAQVSELEVMRALRDVSETR